MNPVSTETFGLMLIFAYVFMCAIFLTHQQYGKSFVDSFDKAFGGMLLVRHWLRLRHGGLCGDGMIYSNQTGGV